MTLIGALRFASAGAGFESLDRSNILVCVMPGPARRLSEIVRRNAPQASPADLIRGSILPLEPWIAGSSPTAVRLRDSEVQSPLQASPADSIRGSIAQLALWIAGSSPGDDAKMNRSDKKFAIMLRTIPQPDSRGSAPGDDAEKNRSEEKFAIMLHMIPQSDSRGLEPGSHPFAVRAHQRATP